MIDRAAAPRFVVVDRLDAVAVRISQERPVVVVPVRRPRAGTTVVRVAGGDAGSPEGIDVLARRRNEADVQAGGRRVLGIDPDDQELLEQEELVTRDRGLQLERRQHVR
jgi:hypothetical protein